MGGRTLASERGFTLVELLVGLTLSFVVLGATLTTFNTMYRSENENAARNDTVELARNALDVQARQLRNLAKRVSSPVIDSLGADNLIFQTADPSRTWVRYRLDTTTSPASTDRGRLWTGELAVPDSSVASPVTGAMRSGCPGSGWSTTRVVADYVTNHRAGLARALFTYGCTVGTACATSASTYDQVTSIAAQTLVDTTPGSGAPELSVLSGVHLRNQNQAPTASFVWSASASRTVVLNASGSIDSEGRTMNYYWFEHAMPAQASIDCSRPTITGSGTPRTLWGAGGYLGEGITLSHTFPPGSGVAGIARSVGLVVCDPGDRFDTAGIAPDTAITIAIPS